MSSSVRPPRPASVADGASIEDVPAPAWVRPERNRASRLIVPVVISLITQVPTGIWFAAHQEFGWIYLVSGLLSALLLLGARRWPGPVVVAVGLTSIVGLALPSLPPLAAVPFAFAIVSACVRGARTGAIAMVFASMAIPVLGFLITTDIAQAMRSLGDIVVLLVSLGIGEAMRVRRLRFAEYREAMDERRRTEAERERVRIARELHDVLAHSLSSINVQAGVGLHLIGTQPDKAGEALASIKATSKHALDDVRTVLGILRGDDEAPRSPEPALATIPNLLAGAESLGLRFAFHDHATPRPSLAVQFASYRIVQEAITNVTKHADATTVTVVLRWDGSDFVTSITDDGAARSDHQVAATGGRGLLGMRERAELLGGTLRAAGRADGGFEVVARIPDERPDS